MADPLSFASLIAKGVESAVALVRKYADSDEVTRLFELLDKEFGESSGLDMTFWGGLRTDPAVMYPILAGLERADLYDEAGLVAALEPLVGALDPDGSPAETAALVAAAMPALARRAKTGDHATRYESDRLFAQIGRSAEAVGEVRTPLRLTWAPRRLLDELAALVEIDENVARQLGTALSDETSRASTARSLVRKRQPWLNNAPAAAWSFLARLCGGHGDYEEAIAAYEIAAQAPGPRPARYLAYAALIATRTDREEEGDRLLAAAREIDQDEVGILLVKAERLRNAVDRLEFLASFETSDPQDAAERAGLAAEAHSANDDLGSALASLEEAKRYAPHSLRWKEIEGMARLMHSGRRLMDGAPNPRELRPAVELFTQIREELGEAARPEATSLLLAREAQCHFMLGDRDQAAEVVEPVRPDAIESWSAQAATEIAATLSEVGRGKDAIELLERVHGGNENVELLLADARSNSPEPSCQEQGIQTLNRLVRSQDQDIRVRAAIARQLLTIQGDIEAPFSPDADAVLRKEDPPLAALLRFEAKQVSGAATPEADLLPHSHDPRVLHRLADLAMSKGELDRAIGLISTAAGVSADPRIHFRHSWLLTQADRPREALAALQRLGGDELPTPQQIELAKLRLEAQLRLRDWPEAERAARRWQGLAPNSEDARSHLAQALARQAKYSEALAEIDGGSSEVGSLQMAHLVGEIIVRSGLDAAKLQRLADLSDQFGRTDERLELRFLNAAGGLGETPLPADLTARLKSGWAEFRERFPESTALTAVSVGDEDLGGLRAFIREHLAPRAQRLQKLGMEVRAGELPLAVLAEASGREASTAWGDTRTSLPLSFGEAALDELEREDARAAVGRPVVLDVSALVIAGGLGADVLEPVLAAFPGAVVSQAAFDDADDACSTVVATAGQKQRAFLGWDPRRGDMAYSELSPEERDRDDARAHGVLAIAKRLKVSPDTDPERPHPLDELLSDAAQPDVGTAYRSLAATYAVADRLRLPVYSDDRVVRTLARRSGRPAFGTVVLLDALAETGVISPAVRQLARRRLWSSGASGVVPSELEILGAGREVAWDTSPLLTTMVADPTPWRISPAEACRRWIAVLRVVHAEAPDELRRWTLRILIAARSAWDRKVDAGEQAHGLLALAWQPVDTGGAEFLRAFIEVLRAAGQDLGFSDPLPRAFALLERALEAAAPQRAAAIRDAALAQLESQDSRLLMRYRAIATAAARKA